MDMPASEITGWQDYIDIYGFERDREDERMALLCQTIVNMSGRAVKEGKEVSVAIFIPDYLGTREVETKTLQEQTDADAKFGAKLAEMQAIR
jgi:hypothetical protein